MLEPGIVLTSIARRTAGLRHSRHSWQLRKDNTKELIKHSVITNRRTKITVLRREVDRNFPRDDAFNVSGAGRQASGVGEVLTRRAPRGRRRARRRSAGSCGGRSRTARRARAAAAAAARRPRPRPRSRRAACRGHAPAPSAPSAPPPTTTALRALH